MQLALHHESFAEALGEVVQVLGGYKAAGTMLWPDRAPDEAGRQLRHALAPDRAEKLSLDQLVYLLKLGRAKRAHGAIAYLARECGYQDPVPIEPDDERAMLQRQFVASATELQKLSRRLDGLRDAPELKVIP